MLPSDLLYNIDSPTETCVNACKKIADSYNNHQCNFEDYLSGLSKSELSSTLSNLAIKSIKEDRKDVLIKFLAGVKRMSLEDWERIWSVTGELKHPSSSLFENFKDTIKSSLRPWKPEINSLLDYVGEEFDFPRDNVERWVISIKYKDVECPNMFIEIPFGIIDHEDGITEIIIDSLNTGEYPMNDYMNWCGT